MAVSFLMTWAPRAQHRILRRCLSEAIEWLDRAIVSADREIRWTARHQKGLALLQLGETAEAIASLEAAAQDAPEGERFDVMYEIVTPLLESGEFDQAMPYLLEIFNNAPGALAARAAYDLGVVCLRRHLPEDASRYLTIAAGSNAPISVEARRVLARVQSV